ncbi:hypothetical protein ACFC1T_02365 [Kitasatospora sp. NPDC056076]|uniref:hypothetical protein n=1 Tax=Kitasatospora sp. NPDC056076 TaxID=3345703 RepID=UPI0035DE454C
MTHIAMDDQHGHKFHVRLDLELDEFHLTAALYSFTFDAVEDISPLSDSDVRDYIAENIAFVGIGQLMAAVDELGRAEAAERLSDWDRQWLEFCRTKVTSAYRPAYLRVA